MDSDAVLVAPATADTLRDESPQVISSEAAVCYRRDRVVVVQLGCPVDRALTADDLASMSLVDARGVPVLVGRS